MVTMRISETTVAVQNFKQASKNVYVTISSNNMEHSCGNLYRITKEQKTTWQPREVYI
jgi:hypothetical protein